MLQTNIQAIFISLRTSTLPLFALLLYLLASTNSVAATENEGSFGLTSFAFASYLGTGFYTTSGQNVFVLQLPYEHIIKEKTDTEAGWVLKLPITVGFINFDSILIESLPGLNDVGTVTFLPGLEYQYPAAVNWTVIPFVDYGFARELNAASNVLIIGAGIKSHYEVHFKNAMFTLGNRFLYAREHTSQERTSGGKTFSSTADADYTLIETGLNYRVTSNYSFDGEPLYTNLYYINFYYPNNLVFFEQTPNPIRVGVEHEIGITFSNIPDFLFFKKPQIGFGIRLGKDTRVYRLIFGMPF